MEGQLHTLLKRCTVKVRFEGGDVGTGFFVAPRLIITCAHAVEEAYAAKMVVTGIWDDQSFSTSIIGFELMNMSAGNQKYKFPDLALLRINTTLLHHPCVYLDTESIPGDKLFGYGYSITHPNGDSIRGIYEGESRIDKQHFHLKFQATQVIAGFSGAPLLNERTGRICGVVQITRHLDYAMGGWAIPTEAIFQYFSEVAEKHQRFHEQDKYWSEYAEKWRNRENLSKQKTDQVEGKRLLREIKEGILKRGSLSDQREKIEQAMRLLNEKQQAEEVAKARFLKALILLDRNLPKNLSPDAWNKIQDLMQGAIGLHTLQSYLLLLALFSCNRARVGEPRWLAQAKELIARAKQMPHAPEDNENWNILECCHPVLARIHRDAFYTTGKFPCE